MVSAKQQHILDAVVAVVSREGIAGVSMRAVAREADVALGLINYHFDDKVSLIAAALRDIGDKDLAIVEPVDGLASDEQLRHALTSIAMPAFLRSDYLAQRLQLWSLASVDPLYADINRTAQMAYRDGLAVLIAAARPDLDSDAVAQRAADILVIQNGIWLTAVLVTDDDAVRRGVEACEAIAFS